ncbi:MAG: hypothetical protein VYC17_01260 [Nitrospinota bacterium]|nr:hypothetical protein [Nitrospinota bacterium]
MIRQTLKVFKALNPNEKPWQLSLGIVFGAVMGSTLLLNLHNLVLIFLALIINLSISIMSKPRTVFGDRLFVRPAVSQNRFESFNGGKSGNFLGQLFQLPFYHPIQPQQYHCYGESGIFPAGDCTDVFRI